MMRRDFALPAALCLLFAGLLVRADPARADDGWFVEGEALVLSSTSTRELEEPLGAGLGFGYWFNDRLGLGFHLLNATFESSESLDFFGFASGRVETEFRVTFVLVQLDVDLVPHRSFDLTIGPIVGLADYGDLEARIAGTIAHLGDVFVETSERLEGGFVWGGHLGFEVPLRSSRAYLTGGVRYLQADIEIDRSEVVGPCLTCSGTESLALNPLAASLGIGFRF